MSAPPDEPISYAVAETTRFLNEAAGAAIETKTITPPEWLTAVAVHAITMILTSPDPDGYAAEFQKRFDTYRNDPEIRAAFDQASAKHETNALLTRLFNTEENDPDDDGLD